MTSRISQCSNTAGELTGTIAATNKVNLGWEYILTGSVFPCWSLVDDENTESMSAVFGRLMSSAPASLSSSR